MLFDYNQIIDDRLWVGALVQPEDARQLRRMGITTVVNLQTPEDLKKHGVTLKKLEKALAEAGIDLVRVPVVEFDSADLARRLPAAVEALERALAPAWARVYLHCSAGVIRSATAAAALIMKAGGATAAEACELLRSRRECEPDLEALEHFAGTLAGEA
ncbi:MAG: dual specificity protein phosphatase family protein [Acidobacteria bacterium]|nr:dual specificity protein phosphatase family protein [Acidobacteriota bacterium]